MIAIATGIVVGVTAALIAILVEQWFSTRSRRVTTTIDLFAAYHSTEMVGRWSDIVIGCQREAARPGGARHWEAVWRSDDEADVRFYVAAAPLVSFFFSLDILRRSKAIDETLAHEYFSYQYSSWARLFEPIIEATTSTADGAREQPNWTTAFVAWRSHWLADAGVAGLPRSDTRT